MFSTNGTVLILAIIAAIAFIQYLAIEAGFNGIVLTMTLSSLFALAGGILTKLFKDRKGKTSGR